jgi:hypothetical protein
MTPMPALAPPPGAIEALNLSPTSRTVPPVAVQGTSGSVADPQNVLPWQPTRLSGTNSSIMRFRRNDSRVGRRRAPVRRRMEVNACFTALAQIRRTGGYMLTSPISTKSTFGEGINAVGSPAYGRSFMSMAHGWSSGPTSAFGTDPLNGIAKSCYLTP